MTFGFVKKFPPDVYAGDREILFCESIGQLADVFRQYDPQEHMTLTALEAQSELTKNGEQYLAVWGF